ncbi:MAG: matrixin family metalloprotease, partial [Planctomycetia bacterium]|nr:matrixin family metalloprotease [Planctomycetia bacterium]
SLGVSGFSAANYATVIDDALDVWASVSAFTNLGEVTDGGADAGALEADDGHLGDIRVAAWEINAGPVLAHAYQPGTEAIFGNTLAGDLHLDVNRTWVDNSDDVSGNGQFDFFTIVLHEFGHSLGLEHSSVSGSVMESTYAGARRTLQLDDIAGIQALYGVPEPMTVSLLLIGLGGILLHRRKR